MILKFANTILRKEKAKLFLPFVSIILTATVVILSFLLISVTSDFLTSKNKEFIGGDVAMESSRNFVIQDYFKKENIKKVSNQLNFQGLLSSASSASAVDFTFVDGNFPLYGNIILEDGSYELPLENEIYIDESLRDNLKLKIGDKLVFNEKDFIVKGVVTQNPESLLGGFSFSPKVILSQDAIKYSEINLDLFRKEYKQKAILSNELDKEMKTMIKDSSIKEGIRANFDGAGESGLQFGLEIVERFLVVVVLIIIILSLVNIYSSVNFLAERLRRSFAILVSLGLTRNAVYRILLIVNSSVIIMGIILGSILAFILNTQILNLVKQSFEINLSQNQNIDLLQILAILFILYVTSLFATLPVLNKLKSLSPKELLSGTSSGSKNLFRDIFKDIVFGLLPVTLISIYFLDSLLNGLLVVVLIVLTYAVVMIFYFYFIELIYKFRVKYNFSLRLIISQKKFDGFLGLITFSSLFIALTAVYNLSVIRTSIDMYLRGDLRENLPSVYILDLQKSQINDFTKIYPDSVLFPNVRARMTSVDGLDIQREIEKPDSKLDREFTREFNLTYRNNLLNSEEVIAGDFANMKKGEVSLEEDFAKRLNASMGSVLLLNIQGFELAVKVTSIRKVDTRSGLPFFFLVFSPEDLAQYPATSFGYLNIKSEEINKLSSVLAEKFPNVSIIDTSKITKIAENVIGLLLIIILIITIPPIVLSTLLIITIIATLSKDRKRDGARLMALGKTSVYVRNFFIAESTVTLILSSGAAYVFALLISNFLIIKYIEIKNIVYFDLISFYIFISLFIGIIALSVFLWIRGSKSIKEYLNYEENN